MTKRAPVLALAALSALAVTSYGSRGSLGLFLRPWEDSYGSSRAAVALTMSIGFVAVAIAQPLAGRLLQVVPPRSLLVVGGTLAAGGYTAAGWADSLDAVIVLVGGVAAFGCGLASLPLLSFVSAEITRSREGVIFGVLTAAAAGGQVVVLPVATAALEVSLPTAMVALGVLIGAATVAAWLFVPDLPPAPREPTAIEHPRRWTVVGDPRFWLLMLPFFICGYTTTGLTDAHLIPYAESHHIGEVQASAALTILAAFNVGGVLVAGVLTDRFDRGRMLAVLYISRALVLLALPVLTSPGGLLLFGALFGIVDFATVPPTTALTRALFGPGRWALVLGTISAGHQIGSAVGAWLGGALFDLTGSYRASFLSAAMLLLIAGFLSWQLVDVPARLPRPSPPLPERTTAAGSE